MRKKLLLWMSLSISILCTAQQRTIICTAEQNSDRTISIYAENTSQADYTVKFNFTLIGYTSSLYSPSIIRVSPGKSVVAKLTPEPNASTRTYNYRFNYYPGVAFRKQPDINIPYLIPATEGTTVRVSHSFALGTIVGQKAPEGFTSTGFQYKFGDTICAARAGTVYNASDDAKEGEKYNQVFSNQRNNIAIQHRDGTTSWYSILAPIKLLVADGEEVIPGQPLAVFNKESDKYTLLYSAYYLDEKKLSNESMDNTTKPPLFYQYIAPNFYTGEAIIEPLVLNKQYTGKRSNEIIGKELSKKEKKKLGIQ